MKKLNLSVVVLISAVMLSWLSRNKVEAASLQIGGNFTSSVTEKGLSPVKLNLIEVDGRAYLVPDSLQIIKMDNGRFKLNQIDLLGHKVGNGGDFIRSTYIQLGLKVIEFLSSTERGNALVTQNKLSLEEIKQNLDINHIVVSDEVLFDNTGSVVDAIGLPGLVILNSQIWLDHFENDRLVYDLIFHEMLRSVGVNDDNYIISKLINPFPSAFVLSTRLIPLIPLIEEDSLQSLIDFSAIKINGLGCRQQSGSFFAELDLTQNRLQLTFNDYNVVNTVDKMVDYSSCQIAIPVQLPQGKKLTISLIDLQGQILPRTQILKTAAQIKFEAFVAGTQSRVNLKTINFKNADRSFLFRRTDVLTSGCGSKDIIRLNTNQVLRSSKVINQNTATKDLGAVNTAQIKKISVYLSLDDCN